MLNQAKPDQFVNLFLTQVSHPKQQKSFLVRLSRVADGSAGPKIFFKVKYHLGLKVQGSRFTIHLDPDS